jgi:hypothetical protein
MTLDAIEFIRRFLLHVLPSGFVKIRHFGLLANRSRRQGCVATFRIAAGDMKELRNANSTGNLQMAADRTQPHTLCGSVVSPLFSFAARC